MDHNQKIVVGAGMVLIPPYSLMLPYTYSVTKSCSNNIAKYNALIIGLLWRGSKICWSVWRFQIGHQQIKCMYKVYNEILVLYHRVTPELAKRFEGF